MAELPRSVVERLKQQAAQEHPDANLLAAFSEQALTGRERDSVLAHLAVCADCRQAVALAEPEELARPVTVTVPWYRRPQTFTWGAVAATLVVGAALVVNYRDRVPQSSETKEARVQKQAPASPPAEASKSNTTEEISRKPEGTGSVGGLVAAAPATRAKTVPPAAVGKKEDDDNLLKAREADSSILLDTVQQKDERANAYVAGPQRDESKAAGVGGVPAATPPPAAAPASENTAVQAQTSASQTVQVQSSAPVAMAGAARAGKISSAETNAATARKAQRAPAAAVLRWSISSDGELQRSADSGRTWQPVSFLKATKFRAVAVVGQDVWAGGPGAILFYSPDSGQTWTRQFLPGGSATITNLQFSDTQHGSALCDDGTAWTTSDGGQTWAKQ